MKADVNRVEAKKLGYRTYTPIKPCNKCHSSFRYTSNGKCVQCSKKYQSSMSNKRRTEINQKYRLKNKEKMRSWDSSNSDKQKEYQRRYIISHPEYESTRSSIQRAKKLERLPKWANIKKIELIYTKCKELTKIIGEPHEVDHIIPLNGEFVSGLHVEYNLRIVSKRENRIKSNKLIEELL